MVPVPDDKLVEKTSEGQYSGRRRGFRGRGPVHYICNDRYRPCPGLVLLYAKMGLHRYNFLQGKNLKLSSVKKYSQSTGSAAATYCITLEAIDPAINSLQTFETEVDELMETKKSEIKRSSDHKPLKSSFFFLQQSMPEWPPQNPFENCYVLNDSELQDNNDWIRLYLELAVATTDKTSKNHNLSNLKILKVAKDTTPQDVDEEFKHTNVAIFYIRYTDSCEARVGKDVDRVAIVRRAFSEWSDCFCLVGQTLSSEIIPKNGKKPSAHLPFSLRLKPWLLTSLRRLKAFKYVGSSRRLHKARSTIEYVD